MGTLIPKNEIQNDNDYWKLIGEKGKVINDDAISEERVLVLFDKNLDDFKVANHNPINNSLWIKKTDLEIQ